MLATAVANGPGLGRIRTDADYWTVIDDIDVHPALRQVIALLPSYWSLWAYIPQEAKQQL